MHIRPLVQTDLAPIKAVIDANDLFPSDLLDEMTAALLADPDGPDIWLTGHLAGPQAVAYCAPERMADAVWNLLLIAVHPQAQGRGHGTALLAHVEALLIQRKQRLLIVETSGLPDFAPTRAFYQRNGYTEVAHIPEFYQAGEDKIVFLKRLT